MKKKVLLLLSRVPYPPIGGDKLKSFNLLKILSKQYEVYLVIVTDEIFSENTVNELEKYTKALKIFVKPRYKFYLNTLKKALMNNLPLQVNYYYFKDVQDYINNISKEVDFAIATLVRMAEYLNNFSKPKFLDIVDSIALNYERSIKNVKSLFWKIIYKIEINRLFNYEKKCIQLFNSTFFVNKFEADYWSSYGNTVWIPNGVNENLLKYNKTDKKYGNSIVFFGKMDYQPNIDAVLWFVENILDKLNKNIIFTIVGANPTKKILELEKNYSNVEVTGFVDDPYLILKSSLCVVAPMQTGGGIQNKILESMALGTINIVSSLAAKPIGAENKKDYFVVDDPFEIAKTINLLYKNKDKFDFMKKNSREFIKNNFTWENYENKLLNIINKTLEDKY